MPNRRDAGADLLALGVVVAADQDVGGTWPGEFLEHQRGWLKLLPLLVEAGGGVLPRLCQGDGQKRVGSQEAGLERRQPGPNPTLPRRRGLVRRERDVRVVRGAMVRGAVEEGEELIIFLLRERIVLVVMALGTPHGRAHPHL